MPSDTTPCECIPTEMKDIIEQVPGIYSNSDEWVDIAEYEVTTFDDPVCKRDDEALDDDLDDDDDEGDDTEYHPSMSEDGLSLTAGSSRHPLASQRN